MSTPVFHVSHGSVVLGGEPVVTDVDLTVEPGEFLSLLGPNGSGKTTLLRALLGLQPLTSGRVELLGEPLGSVRDWARIGYVPQHLLAAGAVPVSVREVVGAGLISPAGRWRRRRDRDERIRSALNRVDLHDRRGDSFHNLSGGQQRRVMIAAVLAKGADILLLDEPTAGVDAGSVHLLHDVLAELSAAGATVVLVTHELGALTDLVTRCVVLGRPPGPSVRYDGPPPPPAELRDPHGHHDQPDPGSLWEGR